MKLNLLAGSLILITGHACTGLADVPDMLASVMSVVSPRAEYSLTVEKDLEGCRLNLATRLPQPSGFSREDLETVMGAQNEILLSALEQQLLDQRAVQEAQTAALQEQILKTSRRTQGILLMVICLILVGIGVSLIKLPTAVLPILLCSGMLGLTGCVSRDKMIADLLKDSYRSSVLTLLDSQPPLPSDCTSGIVFLEEAPLLNPDNTPAVIQVGSTPAVLYVRRGLVIRGSAGELSDSLLKGVLPWTTLPAETPRGPVEPLPPVLLGPVAEVPSVAPVPPVEDKTSVVKGFHVQPETSVEEGSYKLPPENGVTTEGTWKRVVPAGTPVPNGTDPGLGSPLDPDDAEVVVYAEMLASRRFRVVTARGNIYTGDISLVQDVSEGVIDVILSTGKGKGVRVRASGAQADVFQRPVLTPAGRPVDGESSAAP